MSDNIDEIRKRVLKMENQVNFIAMTMSALAKNIKPSKYMTEDEVMDFLEIKVSQMRILRRNGVLIGYSSTGRKFKYKRTEVEEYLEGKKGNEMYAIKVKRQKSVHN